jgi:hypothetical protein
MKFEAWYPVYTKILEEFGFSKEKDEEAAELMYALGRGRLLDSSILKKIIEGRSVAVIGFAINETEYRKIVEEVVITAGKAILRVKEIDPAFTPEIHVTDMEEEEILQLKDTILVLHAHGDNIEKIMSIIPEIFGFIGTTHSRPFDKIYNFGGFTDGDRAACLAKEMGARSIRLYGFNFEEASGIKKKKLYWAKKILELEEIIST